MNRKVRFIVILVIIAVIFSVIAFAVPFKHTAAFWVAYVAELIAIALQYPLFYHAFNGETTTSKVYGLPIARVGLAYLATQTILSLSILSLTFVHAFPNWVAVLLCAVVLGFALLGAFGTSIVKEQIEQVDSQARASADVMENLRTIAKSLPTLTADTELKSALNKLEEDFRFSDPVSNSATVSIENEIYTLVSTLQEHLTTGLATVEEINTIQMKLTQRNAICKTTK